MYCRVALTQCTSYHPQEVRAAVDRAVAAAGGWPPLSSASRVVVKPNLLMATPPARAVTTHPQVVAAVVRSLQEAGARVMIADCPGGPFSRSALERLYRVTGMLEVAEATGAQLNFDTGSVELPLPDGLVIRSLTVARVLAEADLVVGVSKLKTHGLTRLTAAVKLMFGAIPGLKKAEYHLKMPAVGDFSRLLLDVARAIRPGMSVVDGVVGMDGPGPSRGSPRPLGVIAAARDPYALDWALARWLGVDESTVPTVSASIAAGLLDPHQVELVEVSPRPVRPTDFRIPTGRPTAIPGWHRLPGPVRARLDALLRPRPLFDARLCTGCGVCVHNCPPGALRLDEGIPTVNLQECIRCFCCEELCPQGAARIHQPWLMRLMFR